jgi:hypothetical protein
VSRRRTRSQREIVERCADLRQDVRAALARASEAGDPPPEVVDRIWRGEALGTLLWSLRRAELPPYDLPFSTPEVVATETDGAELRDATELEHERESARLWHWRARTTELAEAGQVELLARFASFDQLIAATAMRGHEQGLLPPPLRGDFHAYGKVYRHLTGDQRREAHSVAAERHHALNWLCGLGDDWDNVPLDT